MAESLRLSSALEHLAAMMPLASCAVSWPQTHEKLAGLQLLLAISGKTSLCAQSESPRIALGTSWGDAEDTVTRIVRVDVMVLEMKGIVVVERMVEEMGTIGVEEDDGGNVEDGVNVEVIVLVKVDVMTDEEMPREEEEWW